MKTTIQEVREKLAMAENNYRYELSQVEGNIARYLKGIEDKLSEMEQSLQELQNERIRLQKAEEEAKSKVIQTYPWLRGRDN